MPFGLGMLFLGRAAVVHRESVHVQWQPAAGKHAVVGAVLAQQCLDHVRHELEQFRRACIHALAQRRARWQQADVQRLLVERILLEVPHQRQATGVRS